MKRMSALALVLFCLSGCAHVISQETLKTVDRQVTFTDLYRDPQAHMGKRVLLGGVIVQTVNRDDGTLLEVYETEMDYEGRPVKVDHSEGRFLALYKGFLDSEIYRKGRRVTLAGEVVGKEVRRLGEIDYAYPYLHVLELFLWKEEVVQEPYPWWYGDPWGGYPWYPWSAWPHHHRRYPH